MERGNLFIGAGVTIGGLVIYYSQDNILRILLTTIFCSILILIGAILLIRDRKKKRKEIINQSSALVNRLENFSPTKKMIQTWGIIAIDDKSKKIALKEEIGVLTAYAYSDILRTEILQDGEITYRKSSRVGQVVEGLILADISGAIFGGISSRVENEINEVKTIDLKIVVKDVNKPNVKLRFFDAQRVKEMRGENPLADTHEMAYDKALVNLKHWKDIFEIIIDQSYAEKTQVIKNNSSVGDELIKLNDLKEKGILTEEEFLKEKKKVLN